MRTFAFLKALDKGRIIALPPGGKQECLAALARMFDATPADRSEGSMLARILARESQASTYLGHGVACPHARLQQDGELTCAIGWSGQGVAYGDSATARIVLMYSVPPNRTTDYLFELAALVRMIQRHERLRPADLPLDERSVRELLHGWAETVGETAPPGIPGAAGAAAPAANQALVHEIVDMIRSGYLEQLRGFLASQPAPEVAEIIDSVSDRERILLFRLLSRASAGEVFSLLNVPSQDRLLANMAEEETRRVLSALSPDDRTALFEELPAQVLQRLLDLLTDDERKEALALLSYPADSVGRLMTNRYVVVRAEWTVAEALAHIRRTGRDSETMAMVYVTDEKGVLRDDLPLRKLILADPQARLSDLMDRHYASLQSTQDREEAVLAFRKYGLHALPVTDADGVLLGIVTGDDVLSVALEEATEDIHRAGAVNPLPLGYLRAPLRMLYSRRIGWLVVLVGINVFSGAGIAHFEKLIQSVVALVFFLPLLVDSGGNAGSQAATLVIRGMALGEVKLRDYLRAAWREVLVAAGLGLTMAAAVFPLAWWRSGIPVACVTSAAMVSIVLISSLTGLSLPFVLRRMGMDPAVASAPLVTSIADIMGVIVYFSIASLVFTGR